MIFVFLGISHGFIDDFSKERELIKKFNPDVVLSEEIHDKKLISQNDFEIFLKEKKHSFITPFEQIKDLVVLCRENRIKLIGIDLKNYGFSKKIGERINLDDNFNVKEEKEINRLVQRREELHIKKIKSYIGKSSKPIPVFVGAWHLRDEGLIMKNIQKSLVVYPSDKKGNLIMGKFNGKINYSEKEI